MSHLLLSSQGMTCVEVYGWLYQGSRCSYACQALTFIEWKEYMAASIIIWPSRLSLLCHLVSVTLSIRVFEFHRHQYMNCADDGKQASTAVEQSTRRANWQFLPLYFPWVSGVFVILTINSWNPFQTGWLVTCSKCHAMAKWAKAAEAILGFIVRVQDTRKSYTANSSLSLEVTALAPVSDVQSAKKPHQHVAGMLIHQAQKFWSKGLSKMGCCSSGGSACCCWKCCHVEHPERKFSTFCI